MMACKKMDVLFISVKVANKKTVMTSQAHGNYF